MRLRAALRFALPCGVALATVAFAGCGRGPVDGLIKIDGSSTVFPITALAAERFMADTSGIRVAVGISGTGGGMAKFGRGEIDVANASRPIKEKEVDKVRAAGYDFIELPIAYDGLVVAVHPEASWVDCLTVEELRTMWAPGATVTNWKDVRPGFPDRPLRLYGAGTDSGTYDYFTAAIVGEEGTSRADFTASEDDNVLVTGVAGDRGALAFFGLAYYEESADKVKAVQIDNGDGCVGPSFESVETGRYQPLARPEFVYVRADRALDPSVRAFVRYYLTNARTIVRDAQYVPLSEETYRLVRARFDAGASGTLFHGSTVGVKIADLLRTAPSAASPADSSRR